MRLKNSIFILFAILSMVFTACNNEDSTTPPNNIIPQEKFTKLITDFLLAESATNLNIKQVDITKFDSTYTFNPLKENNISKAQYDSTLFFYSKHPDLYKEIYDGVLQLLSDMQIKQKAKTISDSLKSDKIKKDTQIVIKRKDSLNAIVKKK
jgi:hypothetical protein